MNFERIRRKITLRAADAGRVVGVTVEADVYGPLAVHESVASLRLWTVSHVPTGSLVMCFDEKPGAETFVEALLELNLDWNFARPNECPSATGRAIEQIIGKKPRGGVFWQAEVASKVS